MAPPKAKRKPNPERERCRKKSEAARKRMTFPHRWQIRYRKGSTGLEWWLESGGYPNIAVFPVGDQYSVTDITNPESSYLYGKTPQEAVDTIIRDITQSARNAFESAAKLRDWLTVDPETIGPARVKFQIPRS